MSSASVCRRARAGRGGRSSCSSVSPCSNSTAASVRCRSNATTFRCDRRAVSNSRSMPGRGPALAPRVRGAQSTGGTLGHRRHARHLCQPTTPLVWERASSVPARSARRPRSAPSPLPAADRPRHRPAGSSPRRPVRPRPGCAPDCRPESAPPSPRRSHTVGWPGPPGRSTDLASSTRTRSAPVQARRPRA